MAEYMVLMGAEQVQSAASRMSSAADEMRSAASTIDNAAREMRVALDAHVSAMEVMLAEDRKERQEMNEALVESIRQMLGKP